MTLTILYVFWIESLNRTNTGCFDDPHHHIIIWVTINFVKSDPAWFHEGAVIVILALEIWRQHQSDIELTLLTTDYNTTPIEHHTITIRKDWADTARSYIIFCFFLSPFPVYNLKEGMLSICWDCGLTPPLFSPQPWAIPACLSLCTV